MEFNNLIDQEVIDKFDEKGVISDADSKTIIVNFKDRKKEFKYDAFTRGDLKFINPDYQKIVDDEKYVDWFLTHGALESKE